MSDPRTDQLIARLRARASDPVRRVDVASGTMAFGTRLLDMSALLRGEVTAPRPTPLPPPADAASLARAEARLGFPLPPFTRRIYLEVADGGFGPGDGLLSITQVVNTYAELRNETPGPPGTEWPEGLVPLEGDEAAFTCVERTTGRVVAYDAEELLEHWDPDHPNEADGKRGWNKCFREIAPSIESWLDTWLGTPTVSEQIARRMADPLETHRKNLRESIARYEAMTPEERRRHISDEHFEAIKIGLKRLDEGT